MAKIELKLDMKSLNGLVNRLAELWTQWQDTTDSSCLDSILSFSSQSSQELSALAEREARKVNHQLYDLHEPRITLMRQMFDYSIDTASVMRIGAYIVSYKHAADPKVNETALDKPIALSLNNLPPATLAKYTAEVGAHMRKLLAQMLLESNRFDATKTASLPNYAFEPDTHFYHAKQLVASRNLKDAIPQLDILYAGAADPQKKEEIKAWLIYAMKLSIEQTTREKQKTFVTSSYPLVNFDFAVALSGTYPRSCLSTLEKIIGAAKSEDTIQFDETRTVNLREAAVGYFISLSLSFTQSYHTSAIQKARSSAKGTKASSQNTLPDADIYLDILKKAYAHYTMASSQDKLATMPYLPKDKSNIGASIREMYLNIAFVSLKYNKAVAFCNVLDASPAKDDERHLKFMQLMGYFMLNDTANAYPLALDLSTSYAFAAGSLEHVFVTGVVALSYLANTPTMRSEAKMLLKGSPLMDSHWSPLTNEYRNLKERVQAESAFARMLR